MAAPPRFRDGEAEPGERRALPDEALYRRAVEGGEMLIDCLEHGIDPAAELVPGLAARIIQRAVRHSEPEVGGVPPPVSGDAIHQAERRFERRCRAVHWGYQMTQRVDSGGYDAAIGQLRGG